MNFYQVFIPITTGLFFFTFFVWRTFQLWRQTGKSPFVFSKEDTAINFIGRIYGLASIVSWVSIVLFSFLPEYYDSIFPINRMDKEWLRIAGIVLIAFGYGWSAIAHLQMSTSWRVGIQANEPTKLVDSGLFGVSRNPFFFGVLIATLGSFLVMSNALMLGILITTVIIIQIQVRLEEEHLAETVGVEYVSYMERVRRWV